jgi:nicotinamide mononucleotide transporter
VTILTWLFEAKLTIAGHDILWREIVGNAFGLASAIGGMRRRVWAWPVGIVGNVLLFTVFLGVAFSNPQGATLYGQAGRQVFFVITSVYGWYRWQQTRRQSQTPDAPAVEPRWASARERTAYLLLGAIAVGGCYLLFREIGAGFPAPWWYYLADAWIFVGSILATYAMARGWIDFWLCWIAVDLVGVPELLHFRFYPSAVLYAVYGGFVIWGLFVWRRIARDEALSPAAPAGGEDLATAGSRTVVPAHRPER